MSTLDDIRVLAAQILDFCGPVVYRTPTDFYAAYATAETGTTLVLGVELVIMDPFTVDKTIILQSETWSANQGVRMTKDEPAPSFQGGLTAWGTAHQLRGIEFRNPDHGAAVTWVTATGAVWDRCRIVGDPTHGARRGIVYFGTDFTLSNSYIDDCFHASEDAQAFLAYDCGPGITLLNDYLAGSGQSVMFGGGDSTSAQRIPSNILIDNCDLTKNPAWIGVYQCKCALEFKSAMNAIVKNSRLSYGGTNAGQGCYLIDATVRNQDNTAPWSCVKNIEVFSCVGSHASGIVNFLGTDNDYPSGILDGFNLHDSQFTDMDGSLGAGRLFIVGYAPKHVTLKNLSVSAVHVSALGYFYSPTPPTGFVAQGLTLPPSTYGWILDGDTNHAGAGHAALMAYMPDAVLDGTVI